MGIKGLWSLLAPYSEKKSLYEIRGEVIAVDLSGWVCDSQNVTEYHVQPKLYIRNLFFRAMYLLLADIKPIFVLEGDAPELKRDVMAARNAIQFKGAAPRSDRNASKKKPDVGRKRFKNVLKECESLLKCMGVTCIKGQGEAEATCAQLNALGIVKAVVSQDSDCFAYGAVRVYRNFSVSNSAGGGALQGSVDCYDVTTVYEQLGFGRNKMIALAMLCGCDYGAGAVGSSIATALAFLHTVPDSDIINRLLSWVSDPDVYEEKERMLSVPGRCDRCGHAGRSHAKNGCPVCVTHKSCHDNGFKSKIAETKKELALRKRALSCGSPFPEPLIMREFLHKTPENIPPGALKAGMPSLVQFVNFMTAKLDWSERYCVEKFLPLLTRWHLQDNVPLRTITPMKINKKRTPRGVPSFEVVWMDLLDHYEGLVPDDQLEENEDPSVVWTTIERQDLMRKYYPTIVEAFEEATKKPPKVKKYRAKKTTNDEAKDDEKPKRKYNRKTKKNETESNKENSNCQPNKSLNVSVKIKTLKRKQCRNVKSKNQKTIDSFVAKKRKSMKKAMKSLRDSLSNLSLNKPNNISMLEEDDLCKEDESISIGCYYNLHDNCNYPEQNKYSITSETILQNDADLNPENKFNVKTSEEMNLNYIDITLPQRYNNNCKNPNISSIHEDFDAEKVVKTNEVDKFIEDKQNSLLDILELSDEDSDDINFSDIVDKITNRKAEPTMAKVGNKLLKLVFANSTPKKKNIKNFDCSTPVDSPIAKIRKYSIINNDSFERDIPKVRKSSFFDKITDDADAFEMSINNRFDDSDRTIDYNLGAYYE